MTPNPEICQLGVKNGPKMTPNPSICQLGVKKGLKMTLNQEKSQHGIKSEPKMRSRVCGAKNGPCCGGRELGYRSTGTSIMFSMSLTHWRKSLSVAMRSWTVLQACSTVAWSLPPISMPMVESEQLRIWVRHSYMAI